MSNETLTRHCHQCGWEWPLATAPGRTDSCNQCHADMKVCLNCVSYDARAAQQCRDRRAELVHDKHLATFCEYFEFARREWQGKGEPDKREQDARDALKKLLGD